MTLAPFLGFGIGLRREHYDDVLSGAAGCDWFEAISENYMDTGGRPLAVLEHVRRDWPVAVHGVGLSIGGTDPLDRRYLRNLRALIDRIQPALVTDHLCWTGVNGRSLYDLLPLPYTEESLAHVIARVQAVQHELGQRLVFENPSTYVAYRHSTIAEWDFLAAVSEAADCGILLDVNNVYVSSYNLGFGALPRRDSVRSRGADSSCRFQRHGHLSVRHAQRAGQRRRMGTVRPRRQTIWPSVDLGGMGRGHSEPRARVRRSLASTSHRGGQ